MKHSSVDTNVILRYLVADPTTIDPKFRGVYSLFKKLESGRLSVELPQLVLFQAYFVLTSFYEVPRSEAAEKLHRLVAFRGVCMLDKAVVQACLGMLEAENLDIVDAYILAWSQQHGLDTVYSFDDGLRKRGLKLLKVK